MALQTTSGVTLSDLRGDGLYRGYADGDTNQVAAFLIRKDHFSGYFRLDGKFWQIDQLTALSTDFQGDVTNVFTKYEHAITPNVECSSNFVEAAPTGAVEVREGTMRHLELAYEVDGEMYAQLGSEAAVQDYISKLMLKEEERYQALSMAISFKFHVVHINIWKDGATDPYSGDIQNRWTQLKNWWQNPANGKGCIQRDAVIMMSGATNPNASGFVDYSGFNSICGSPYGQSCTWFPYSVSRYTGSIEFDANKTSHELAHNFGVGHKCLCGLMLSSDACVTTPYPACTAVDRFDALSRTRILSYFANTFSTCKNGNVGPSDACMIYAPPVDMGFNLTLTSDQVIMTDISVLCLGDSLNASFYNNYDPYGSLAWSLGPLLAFDNNAPANSLTRKIKVAGTAAICSPFDSWVEVSFNYGCGGPPVTYRRLVRLGSTFDLDGTYTGLGGPGKTISSANNVAAGSYDIQLENPNLTYTWTQTIGSTTTALPYTTNRFSFGIVASQSISFTVSAISQCCPFQRTFAFFANGGFLPPIHGNTGSLDHKAYPNPATNALMVIFGRTDAPPPAGYTLVLFDALGRVVRQVSGIGAEQYELALGSLAPGLYRLRINDGQQVQTMSIQKL